MRNTCVSVYALWFSFILIIHCHTQYAVTRGYIFAVSAVMRKVAAANNCSNPSINLNKAIKKTGYFLLLTSLEHLRESCVAG